MALARRLFLIVCFYAGLLLGVRAAEPAAVEVTHSPKQPHSGEVVKITARYDGPADSALLEYQMVEPGKYIALADPEYKKRWQSVAMAGASTPDPQNPGVHVFSAELPGTVQKNRNLVRYRIRVNAGRGETVFLPSNRPAEPNYAYFVYDGIPAWRGAIEPRSSDSKRAQLVAFPPEVMRGVQAYHLISKQLWIENATWREQDRGKEYKYTGTFVFDGEVYDHVFYRARGGDWRYAMGKNMWKVAFHDDHRLDARDDYGQPYRVKWAKLNLRSCIQQGDYGHRGEQGMFEAVGFALFNLAGVEAPRTHWVQFRIVSGENETPANQYQGDFWGLYLAIENEDGRFLKEHRLQDGNLYKMMFSQGLINHQATGASTNGSDVAAFIAGYQRGMQPESWWQQNVDLPRYYSYRAILEAIHHYDIAMGKNYDFYLNPETHRWTVIPWDIDLTWADNMFGTGEEPFKRQVLARPAFRAAYQNRLREIRDLLFNPEQTGALIDEFAAVISRPAGALAMVDADRAKWDFHPAMAGPYSMRGKADQGLFYQASPTGTFAGMPMLMKEYVKRRSAYIDNVLLRGSTPPPPPRASSITPAGFPADRLKFQCSDLPNPANFAAMEWRAGAVRKFVRNDRERHPGEYEMKALWQSGETKTFQKEVTIPPDALKPGETCRVRVRVKDTTGQWSHWSEPVQFVVGNAAE